jgi:hypothetical protein
MAATQSLSQSSAAKSYKVQIYTHPAADGGEGGTDGNVYCYLKGTFGNTGPNWHECDSPGGSHEQGDFDQYYFTTNDLGTDLECEFIVDSCITCSSDHWTFTFAIYSYDYNAHRWVQVRLPERRTVPAFPHTVQSPYAMSGSCHYDSSDAQWSEPAGNGPPGVNLCELSPW